MGGGGTRLPGNHGAILTRSYVEPAMISGDSAWRVVRDCIPPNLWIPLLILMSAELSLIILANRIARIIAENLGIKG